MSDPEREITPAQCALGDMDPEEFRAAAHRVADCVADYLGRLETYRVLPDLRPGEVASHIPEAPPKAPEPLGDVLSDYAAWIEPNITHWQHPGFLAYFASVASGPGILGEWLAAGLNSNVMFWKNAPASTELEQRIVSWLRQMLGLPAAFDGMLTDTASVSSLLALTAARQAVPGLDAREQGLAGRPGVGPLCLYASSEAHSSIEKAAIVIGVGRAGLQRIPTDERYRMRPELLEQAIARDRAAGRTPFCVVGTLGTTSSASIDPARAIAAICERERLWFHVDAAYGGAAAVVPEYRPLLDGWERADSIVFNPHKWLFTPFDASLLLFRRAEAFRETFSLVPEYLRASQVGGAVNYSEYGIQLGRRFRALKLWMLIRYFGVDGLARRIREHCRLAREFADRLEGARDWELLAPVSLSTVCFRHHGEGMPEDRLDQRNEAILEQVNRSGRVYLSGTRLAGRFALRLSLGNPRTTADHVKTCWDLLDHAARTVEGA